MLINSSLFFTKFTVQKHDRQHTDTHQQLTDTQGMQAG